MFKNCCGCPGKKSSWQDSEEKEEEDEEKKEKETIRSTASNASQINNAECEQAAKTVSQSFILEEEDTKTPVTSIVLTATTATAASAATASATDQKNEKVTASSMKKPKHRLSISTEIKIIPTNFPEDFEDENYDEEKTTEEKQKAKVEEEEEEEEDDDVEKVKISVKNIDGKIIRKSVTDEEERKSSLEGENRVVSPLSDEVFVANEKSHLELPLHNLGVKMDNLPLGLNISDSPKKPTARAQKRVSLPAVLPKWLSEEDEETGGSQEPPVTPVARDELALRRHRFFAELLTVAQAASEHRVRFDPFGPTIEILSSEGDQGTSQPQVKEFQNLLSRLENITLRLEKTVPLLEKGADALEKSLVVTKSLEDLLDEHLTPAEKESLNLIINSRSSDEGEKGAGEEETTKVDSIEEKNGFIIISPDSSADFDELSDKDLVLVEEEIRGGDGDVDKYEDEEEEGLAREVEKIQSASDRSENSSASQNTVVCGTPKGHDTETVSLNEVNGRDYNRKEGNVNEEAIKMTNSQSTLNMSLQGFQQVLQGPLASYLQVSASIGGDVFEHSKIVQEAFQAQLQYLSLAAQSSRPSQTEEMKLLQPTSQRIEAIQSFREKHRTSNYFNHLSAISESIPALGWVTVSPAPAPYVKEMNDAGQFYTNRVLKDWKEKDKIHVDWTKAWIQTLSELQAFVKQYHTTGLVWGGTSAPKLGNAPPPPPPGGMPPPPPMLDLGDMAPAPGQDRSALFAEINQGENITRNLKKVTADMQTHKNPAIRAGPAPFKTPPASIQNQVPKPFKATSPPEKPPKFAREGKKWFIEHQKGNHQLVVENAEMNNVVYVFKCTDSTLVVKGKVNSIFLDSCKKTAVVFDSVVSSIEFVNCQSVQMQVLGMVPTISIDKTDGCQMYLSQDSLNVEIVSSKSSEMNVLVPTGSGDFKEYPVPEQFKTIVNKQGLSTTAVENKG